MHKTEKRWLHYAARDDVKSRKAGRFNDRPLDRRDKFGQWKGRYLARPQRASYCLFPADFRIVCFTASIRDKLRRRSFVQIQKRETARKRGIADIKAANRGVNESMRPVKYSCVCDTRSFCSE